MNVIDSSSTVLDYSMKTESKIGSNESEPRNAENDETRELTTEQLKRLVLLEQLRLIRLQTAHYPNIVPIYGTRKP